jgi:hypothetical protein
MPSIVAVNKLFQAEIQVPANVVPHEDGSPVRGVQWRASFVTDSGSTLFDQVTYELLDADRVQNDIVAAVDPSGNPLLDENGDQIFMGAQTVIPNPSPAAAALLRQGLVDEAVEADMQRVKADIENPNSPVGE